MLNSDPYVADHFDLINMKLSEEQVEKMMIDNGEVVNENMLELMNQQISKLGILMNMVGSVNWDQLMESRRILIENLETIQIVLRKYKPDKGLLFRVPPVNMNTYRYFTMEHMRSILIGLGDHM